MILILLFISTGCEYTHTVTCVTDTTVYIDSDLSYNIDKFTEEDFAKLKNIKKFPVKVLFSMNCRTMRAIIFVIVKTTKL